MDGWLWVSKIKYKMGSTERVERLLMFLCVCIYSHIYTFSLISLYKFQQFFETEMVFRQKHRQEASCCQSRKLLNLEEKHRHWIWTRATSSVLASVPDMGIHLTAAADLQVKYMYGTGYYSLHSLMMSCPRCRFLVFRKHQSSTLRTLFVSVPYKISLHCTELSTSTLYVTQGVGTYLHTGVPGTETEVQPLLFSFYTNLGKRPQAATLTFLTQINLAVRIYLEAIYLGKTSLFSHS